MAFKTCGHLADASLVCGEKCFCRECWLEHLRTCECCQSVQKLADVFYGGLELQKQLRISQKKAPAES